MERSVTIINRKGKKLFGIVHVPDQTILKGRKVGINLLNPGIKYRVAPNRLNVKIARKLCDSGYYVLRFDPEGIGDSEGDLPESVSILEVFSKIQDGLFVDDTLMANGYMREEFGIDALILVGNCGGAITALVAAAENNGIDALCLIDVPVYRSNVLRAKGDNDDILDPGASDLRKVLETHLRELRDPATLIKLISQRSAYQKAWKMIVRKVRGKREIRKLPPSEMNLESFCKEYQLNPLFYRSIDAVLHKHIPMLFIASQFGPGRDTFDKFYLQNYWEMHPQRERSEGIWNYISIEKANHVLSLIESQDALYRNIGRWLGEHYPVGNGNSNNERL